MGKQLFFGEDARKRVLDGAEILYNAVKTTMGPKSGNAVIGGLSGPTVTHDGVTVAKSVVLTDSADTMGQSAGVELIKQAAIKMNDNAGDGTTTVTVLTYHLLKEANKLITAGYNAMQLRRELEKAAEQVLEELKEITQDVGNRVEQVGTISAGDPVIGKLIAEVIDNIGKDGVVTVEEGQGLELESEIVDGFTFNQGFLSAYFVTDQERQEAILNQPYVLLLNKRVSFSTDFIPILNKVIESGKRELLIIADALEGEALGTIVLNKIKGVVNVVVVQAPSSGQERVAFLEDVATLTNAKIIDSDNGEEIQEIGLDYLGGANKVVVTKDQTTIIGGKGDVKERVVALESQIKDAPDYQKDQLELRKAALLGKVAVIRVGGATATEIEEKKFRVDDAVHAVKAALAEGIVPGGGNTTLHLALTLDEDSAGSKILKAVLQKPTEILLENAGLPIYSGDSKALGTGIDVQTGNVVDLLAEGIVDPSMVVREAIQNAVSVAGVGMTMGVLIVEEPKKEQDESLQRYIGP